MKLIKACTLILSLAIAPSLFAGNADLGKEKAVTCVACHGEGGLSTIPENPVLAGQHADYLEHALKAYQSGARNNAIMKGMAANLSQDDIEDLAAYFSSQDGLYLPPVN